MCKELRVMRGNRYARQVFRGFFFLCLLSTLYSLLSTAASAQGRDYFTDEEVEMIREAQQIDMRMDLLAKIIDRRFAVLNIDVGAPKMSKKESDKWGKPPEGSHTQLLSDIKNILQKAIDDIDNLSERPTSMVIDPDEPKDKKKPKDFANLFPKAVRTLAKAAERYKPALTAELDKTKDEHEKGIILDSIEMCDDIIASVSKLK